MEQRHGGEFIGALNAGGDLGDVSREREVDDGGGGVLEGFRYKWAVGGGGDNGDGCVGAEEEAGQVEEGDGVTFGHEWKKQNVGVGLA